MMSSTNLILQRDACAQASFRIFPDGRGHWCACKDDGMVSGVFFNRDAAIRFARHESAYGSMPTSSVASNGELL